MVSVYSTGASSSVVAPGGAQRPVAVTEELLRQQIRVRGSSPLVLLSPVGARRGERPEPAWFTVFDSTTVIMCYIHITYYILHITYYIIHITYYIHIT